MKAIILFHRIKNMFVCFVVVKQPTLSQCVKASEMTGTWCETARLDYRSPHSKFYGRPFWLVSCIEFSLLPTKVKHLLISNTPCMELEVSLSCAQNSAPKVYSYTTESIFFRHILSSWDRFEEFKRLTSALKSSESLQWLCLLFSCRYQSKGRCFLSRTNLLVVLCLKGFCLWSWKSVFF